MRILKRKSTSLMLILLLCGLSLQMISIVHASNLHIYEPGKPPPEHDPQYRITYNYQTVIPKSGNTYRFKIKPYGSSFREDLYLVLDEEEYLTKKKVWYSWYFDWSCYCWRRKTNYDYNYVDLPLDDIDGTYEYYYKKGDYTTADYWCLYFGDPPEPTSLIGSTQRYFSDPGHMPSSLGFTIHSTYEFADDPIINFRIVKSQLAVDWLSLKLYVDNELIYYSSVFLNDVGDSFEESVGTDLLRQKGSHQIIIEIDAEYHMNEFFSLGYLKVGSLEFRECDPYETDLYTPPQIYYFDNAASDFAHITTSTLTYFDDETFTISGSHHPLFGTGITVFIDPDRDKDSSGGLPGWEYFYIYKVTLNWTVIDPFGNFIYYSNLSFPCDLRPREDGYRDSSEIRHIVEYLDLGVAVLGPVIPDYIQIPLELAFYLLNYEQFPPRISHGNLGDYTYEGSWHAGHDSGLVGSQPNPQYDEFSMLVGWGPTLTLGIDGPYQVVLGWAVQINNFYHSVCGDVENYGIEYGFTKYGIYYFNFNYQ